MVWGSEEVSESPSDSFGVQLKHHPLPSNNASQVSHSCVCNVNFYLEQRKQLFFWARFWSTFWMTHPLACWNSVSKSRAQTRLQMYSAQIESLNTGSPGFVLHDKFIRTIKHFLKLWFLEGHTVFTYTMLVCMQTEDGIMPDADTVRAPSSAGIYHCSSIDFNELAPVYINWGAVALCGTISFLSFSFILWKNTEMSFFLIQRKESYLVDLPFLSCFYPNYDIHCSFPKVRNALCILI